TALVWQALAVSAHSIGGLFDVGWGWQEPAAVSRPGAIAPPPPLPADPGETPRAEKRGPPDPGPTQGPSAPKPTSRARLHRTPHSEPQLHLQSASGAVGDTWPSNATLG